MTSNSIQNGFYQVVCSAEQAEETNTDALSNGPHNGVSIQRQESHPQNPFLRNQSQQGTATGLQGHKVRRPVISGEKPSVPCIFYKEERNSETLFGVETIIMCVCSAYLSPL